MTDSMARRYNDPGQRRRRWWRERVMAALLTLAGFSAVAITIAIVVILVGESWGFFAEVSLREFLTGREWAPMFAEPRYGIAPLLAGTVTVSVIALIVAVPLGILTAIYLSEFARPRVREVVKPMLELISGLPTVVFGYFALLFVTPWLQQLIPGLPAYNMLSAGLVIGLMIVPYISSLSEDAMRAVPMQLREASYGLGASRFQTAVRVVVPAAMSGIVAACVLAISRAIGETMVVAIAAGQQPNLSFDPTQAAATLTAYIVQVAMGDLPYGSIGYRSIFAAGLVLFVLTLFFNVCGYWLRRRYREVY